MAHNLELKARCRSLASARRIARSLGAKEIGVMRQTDTYFDVPSGRLKLREIRGTRNELIFYERPTTAAVDGRWSAYVVYPLSDRRRILDSLNSAWRPRVVVRKQRTLFLLQNARIHLDRVEGLGTFIEFEVLLRRGPRQAERLYRRLRSAFGIRLQEIVGGSYADLLGPLRRRR